MHQNIMSFHGNFSHQLTGKRQCYPLGLRCAGKVGIIEAAPLTQSFPTGVKGYTGNDD